MYSKIIIGAGLYGLYSTLYCLKNGENILLLEYDDSPFKRATYINQARVHMGYHYPRSLSTAIKSAKYFERFNDDYGFCIKKDFKKIYATSNTFSWTNSEQFKKFCLDSGIICEEINSTKYFKTNMCDGAFITKEYTYDSEILKNYLIKEINKYNSVEIIYNARIKEITKNDNYFEIELNTGNKYQSSFVLNATYASVNQILKKASFTTFDIKYELCEIILCKTSDNLKNIGITVMDGPFFSIMPFGKTGLHSLTSVTFTPHETSYDSLPNFNCQNISKGYCSPIQLGNCNECQVKPKSSWDYMSNLTKKYLKDEFEFDYLNSLFSIKPILKISEIDDSRPTLIKQFSENPTFISVLSGKINTVYDLEEILKC